MLIDLRTPGVEITPIRQITGDSEFNEVRFTDVQVPATNLLGDLHDGWRVATTTLGFERVGQSRTHRIERRLGHVVRLALEPDAEGHRSIDDDAVAHRLADYAARVEGLRFIGAQATAAEVLGETSLPSASVAKLLTSEVDQEMAEFGLDLAAIGGLLGRGSPGAAKNGAVSASYLLMRAATLGAGTSEMQRNVIGEKLLGLPRDH
ncbi:MAG: acyl-CoA dehydrogenase family protein [Acidimicrobiales bacterium]